METDPFDYPNEGEVIENPSFVCEACGYANVTLVDISGPPAAKCTHCGVGYLATQCGGKDDGD